VENKRKHSIVVVFENLTYYIAAALEDSPLQDQDVQERRGGRQTAKEHEPRTDPVAAFAVDDPKVLRQIGQEETGKNCERETQVRCPMSRFTSFW